MIIPAGISQQKKPHENPTFFLCQTQQPDLGSGQEWHQLGIELHLGTRIKPCTWCVYFTIIHIYMVWYVNILHTIKIHITFVSTIYSFIDLLDIIWQGKTHVNTAIASPETPCGVSSWAVAIADDIWGPWCSLLILIFGRMNSTRLINLGNGKPSNSI